MECDCSETTNDIIRYAEYATCVPEPLMHPESSEKGAWRQYRPVLALFLLLWVVLIGRFLKNAVDRYTNLAVNAKRAEGLWRLQEIRDAELKHFQQHGVFVAAGPTPAHVPGKQQSDFRSEHMDAWSQLGWRPDSMVRCQYEVTVPTPTSFQAVARCDADGDGQLAVFESNPEEPPKRVSPENHY